MLNEDILGSIGYLEQATPRLGHLHVQQELYNILLGREEVEDAWDELDQAQRAIVRSFDRALLRESEQVIREYRYMATEKAIANKPRNYWWYFLNEIKAGTLELPADLRGAA